VPSGQAALTVLPDADGDGIPDSWESLYFGGPTAADAAQDSDGDKMSNWAEYMAGTDPNDPLSYLKVDQAQPDPASNQWVRIEFHAVAAHTYTVQSSDKPTGGPWTKVADVPARATNAPVSVYDTRPAGAAPRYFDCRRRECLESVASTRA